MHTPSPCALATPARRPVVQLAGRCQVSQSPWRARHHAWLVSSLAMLALGSTVAPVQAGLLELRFSAPEQYTDAGQGAQAQAVRAQLEQVLSDLVQHRLPAGQTLAVTVTDIDLAGSERPFGRWPNEVRVLTGRADWPRLSLSYELRQAGQVLQSGQEQLSDMNYLHAAQRPAPGAAAYEARLLARWFHGRFDAPVQGASAKP